MSNGNGGSYQKFDGASGTYQEIPNGASVTGSKKKKWIWLVAALALAGIGYASYSMVKSNPTANVHKTLATKGNVHVKSDGKLKLFDSISKLLPIAFSTAIFEKDSLQ